jgi:hypothetical protein
VLALAAAAALGGGYVWVSRPYEAERATLRSRVKLLDFVAPRIITMTPGERRQFAVLIKGAARQGGDKQGEASAARPQPRVHMFYGRTGTQDRVTGIPGNSSDRAKSFGCASHAHPRMSSESGNWPNVFSL